MGKMLSTCMLVPGRLTVRRLLEAPPARLKDTPHRCSLPTQRALAAPIAARAPCAWAAGASSPATAQTATTAPVARRRTDFMCPPLAARIDRTTGCDPTGEWRRGSNGRCVRPCIIWSRPDWELPVARLDDYSFGRLTVDGIEQRRDVIVLPDRVVTDWWRRDGHALVIDDLREVLDELPERLIVGNGAHGRLTPHPAVIDELRRRGVEVEVLETDDAVRRYNQLDQRRVAAALHLTC